MVPAWLIARRPPPNALYAYVCLALRGTYNPGAATYAEIHPSVATLAADMGVSEPTARRALADLESIGGVSRVARRKGSRQTSNAYVIHFGRVVPPDAELAGQGQPLIPEPLTDDNPNPEVEVQPITGEPLRSDRVPITQLRNPERTTPDSPPLRSGESARTIIENWIDWLGTRPPGRVVGQVAKLVGEMLAEGIAADPIKIALADMSRRSLHPSVLPSLVAEQQVRAQRSERPEMAADVTGAPGGAVVAIRPRATTTGVTNQRVTAGLELAERYRSEGR